MLKSSLKNVSTLGNSVGIVAAVLFSVGWGATVQGQCDPIVPGYSCTPPNASQVKYVDSNPLNLRGYVPTTPPAIVPDRRPVFWYHLYAGGGHRTCTNPNHQPNPTGEIWMWSDAASFGESGGLKENMDNLWNAGFRRIVLERPVGGLIGNNPAQGSRTKVAQAAYLPLKQVQKDILHDPNDNPAVDDLHDWIEIKRFGSIPGGTYTESNPDATFEFGAFIGSWQGGSACTPCLKNAAGSSTTWDCTNDDTVLGFSYNGGIFYNPTSASSMEELYQNVKPWMDLGFDTIYFDNSSTWDMNNDLINEDKTSNYVGPERLLDLMQSPDYSTMKFGGEAIPRDLNDPNKPIDSEFSDKAAWFATYKVAKGWGWFNQPGVTVDPNTTELGISFGDPGGNPSYGIAEMADVRDRGFLIWISHADAIPFVQRLYDGENNEFYNAMTNNGTNLSPIADFNNDGTINCNDFNTFITNWQANFCTSSCGNPSVWDGDIDNDDDVDWNDYYTFLALYDWSGC